MINAFLVFNGQGQPRLTKFYTQLVRALHKQEFPALNLRRHFSNRTPTLTDLTGHEHSATPHLGNLHPRLKPPRRLLQLPPPSARPRRLGHLAHIRRAAQRCPFAGHVPPLRNPLLHRHLYLNRVTPRVDRPDPSLRGGPGQAV